MATDFAIYGPPATKGSTKAMVNPRTRKTVVVADCRSLGAWTQAIRWAARTASLELVPRPRAVKVEVTFTFVRPASVKNRPHHTVKPDVDKLERAVLDALTGIAYEDDAQVTDTVISKRYGRETATLVRVSEVLEESLS